ncbi:MAG TPA: 23S rRNA (adenine(2503)-C(2))-methyltransferase RlmN [Bacteroidales bacterium]|nr:23S rRNA (adenine(2503)-C(2))-methyltransferase RlmN [Bacteroidales bacterium]HOH83753.1 23S rRNA (adenine(2503)-C(2))-methyltransferase RlmN [Bacteroidales bacterium]HPI29768.1 23S rRNA (adenine(2503)-C(2))-methyltransferase RlmN [Bacteroidales bacterium]
MKNLSQEELVVFIKNAGEQAFRAKQISEWLWRNRCVSFDEMTNISASLREQLKEAFICSSIQSFDEYVSADGTRKYTLLLTDGNIIECVLIPSDTRVTACISSQAGCPLACEFCATGQLGFSRSLDTSEIHDQIMLLMNFSKEKYQTELDNIVVMGMGEPLLNYNNVMSALGKISDKNLLNFSPQRITLSTAGIVEGIKQMADENSPFHLALSLHSAIEHKRKSMMPIARKYTLEQLIEALRYYHSKTNNRITIEYILFDKLNDTLEDAEALAAFCRNVPVKINIISYNATAGNIYRKSKAAATTAFINFLKNKNIIVNLRASKGNDIMAACGQLAMNKNKNKL